MRTSSIMLLVSLLLQSCSPVFFRPPAHFTPGIKSKGEKVLAINGAADQANLQYAQGITDILAVQSSISGCHFKSENYMFPTEGNRIYGAQLEAGLGLYKNLGEGIHCELYGLGSVGHVTNKFRSSNSEFIGYSGELSANLYRIGIQPSISYSNSWLNITGALRWSTLHYDNIRGTLTDRGYSMRSTLQSMANSSLLESSLTAQLGGKRLRLQIQLIDSRNLRYKDFPMETANVLLGLQYRFR